jgi:RNA polymerase sigma-70 factor (ECF subfamily)
MGTPTDQELMDLLDRIAAQDEPALRSLYEATSSRLYGLALRILRHKDWTATCTSGAAPRATGAR